MVRYVLSPNSLREDSVSVEDTILREWWKGTSKPGRLCSVSDHHCQDNDSLDVESPVGVGVEVLDLPYP